MLSISSDCDTPVRQVTESVRLLRQDLLLVENHPRIVDHKCLMACRGVMEIFPGVPFHICIANMLAKAVSLTCHMIVASKTNAPSHIIHARSDEPDMLGKPKLINTIHANEQWAELNTSSRQLEGKPYFSVELRQRQCRQCNPATYWSSGPKLETDTKHGRRQLVNRYKIIRPLQCVSGHIFKYAVGITTYVGRIIGSDQSIQAPIRIELCRVARDRPMRLATFRSVPRAREF